MSKPRKRKNKPYRGFISFARSAKEFVCFKDKINRYYNWCGALGIDPADDENYNSFCEAESAYKNG